MEHTITQYKRCILVSVKGRIDHFTAPKLDEILTQQVEGGFYKMVLDLSGVNFISSAGWWTLIKAQKACKRFNRGEVVFVGLEAGIRDSMNLVGMGDYFKIYENVTDAVGGF
jgi:anti-sigma B factor antagonist